MFVACVTPKARVLGVELELEEENIMAVAVASSGA
jgi:hypothetical protein